MAKSKAKSQKSPLEGGSFLPAEYVKGKSQIRSNIMVLMLFTLVLAGVVGAFVVNHQRWNRVHQEQTLVAQEFEAEAEKIKLLQDLETQRVDLIERAEIVTALKDRVPRSVLLGEIIRSVPEGMTLTMIDLDGERVKIVVPKEVKKKGAKSRTLKGKNVGKGKDTEGDKKPAKVLPPKFRFSLSIEGIADNNELVTDFFALLKNSPLFGDAELPYINETTLDKQKFRKFKITLKLLNNADAHLVAGTEEVEIGVIDFGVAGKLTDTD